MLCKAFTNVFNDPHQKKFLTYFLIALTLFLVMIWVIVLHFTLQSINQHLYDMSHSVAEYVSHSIFKHNQSIQDKEINNITSLVTIEAISIKEQSDNQINEHMDTQNPREFPAINHRGQQEKVTFSILNLIPFLEDPNRYSVSTFHPIKDKPKHYMEVVMDYSSPMKRLTVMMRILTLCFVLIWILCFFIIRFLYLRFPKIYGMDMTTKVHDSEYMEKQIMQEITRVERYDRPFALLFIEIDQLPKCRKKTRLMLASLATALTHLLRRSDIIGHCALNYNRFVILLPEQDEDQGRIVANKIYQNVKESTFHLKNKVIDLSVSIGLNIYRPGVRYETFLYNTQSTLFFVQQNNLGIGSYSEMKNSKKVVYIKNFCGVNEDKSLSI